MKMHRFEEIWLVLAVAVIVISMVLTGYQTFALGMGPPSNKETIDPQKVDETAPFDEPGVYEIGENEYEVVMTLQIFSFNPGDIEIPAGSKIGRASCREREVHDNYDGRRDRNVTGVQTCALPISGYQTFALGMGPPSNKETIDPQKVDETAPFDEPGVYEIGENEYEVVMTLQIFSFNPGDIEIPAGS